MRTGDCRCRYITGPRRFPWPADLVLRRSFDSYRGDEVTDKQGSPDSVDLSKRALQFRLGTRRLFGEGQTKGDMWFFELWHFLGDVQDALAAPEPSSAGIGEPVAWRWNTKADKRWRVTVNKPVKTELTAFDQIEPLYLAAALAQPAWQPISTAPQDGTIIDLWWVHNDGEHESYRRPDCSWHSHFEGWFWDGVWGGRPPKNRTATHWMPRPSGPPISSTQLGTASTTAGEVQLKEAALTIALASPHGASND